MNIRFGLTTAVEALASGAGAMSVVAAYAADKDMNALATIAVIRAVEDIVSFMINSLLFS